MAQRISGEHRSVDVEGIGLLEIDRTVYNWFNNIVSTNFIKCIPHQTYITF